MIDKIQAYICVLVDTWYEEYICMCRRCCVHACVCAGLGVCICMYMTVYASIGVHVHACIGECVCACM